MWNASRRVSVLCQHACALGVSLLLVLCLTLPAAAVVGDEEFVGPFPSWTNVKTIYGAVGNGIADDTVPLQNALNAVGTGSVSVLYVPAGTYKITAALSLTAKIYVSLIGENPATTILSWAGVADGTGVMLHVNGVAYSRINRLTFNGNGTAYNAVDQSWDGSSGNFDTGNEYMDDIFTGVKYGILGGATCCGFAETTVMRAKFLAHWGPGSCIWLGNFNALDLYVWFSTFEDCRNGISNGGGAGNWRVYNSLFKRSILTDNDIGNTGGFSFRHNTSINSQRFVLTSGTNNPATLNAQGNIVLDAVNQYPIEVSNQGPLWLVDNTFRSPAAATTGVVWHGSPSDSDTIALGNTFTLASPIDTGTGARLIDIDTAVVSRASLLSLGEPSMPTTPLPLGRTVFEVAAGANTATIQAALNSAAAVAGTKPVVHLPSGTYPITTTLTIAANSDVQLIGDTYGTTILQWSGAGTGPVLAIHGPSTATLRDLQVHGNSQANGMLVDGVDQVGARVFLGQVELRQGSQTHLWVDGLDNAIVDVRNVGSANTAGVSVKVVGGPLAAAGTPAGGSTRIYSGASSSNTLSYQVVSGGSLLVRDMWYETPSPLPAFLDLSTTTGTFTLEGCRVALPAHQTPPALAVTSFRGKATFLTTDVDDRVVMSGSGTQTRVLGLGLLGKFSPYFVNTTSCPPGQGILLNARQAVTDIPGNASIPVANQGTLDPVFLKDMVAQTRAAQPALLDALPAGVSDVRFYRVWIQNTLSALHLRP
jgi:pectate lyase-like protein